MYPCRIVADDFQFVSYGTETHCKGREKLGMIHLKDFLETEEGKKWIRVFENDYRFVSENNNLWCYRQHPAEKTWCDKKGNKVNFIYRDETVKSNPDEKNFYSSARYKKSYYNKEEIISKNGDIYTLGKIDKSKKRSVIHFSNRKKGCVFVSIEEAQEYLKLVEKNVRIRANNSYSPSISGFDYKKAKIVLEK